jgi:hypothetical protein
MLSEWDLEGIERSFRRDLGRDWSKFLLDPFNQLTLRSERVKKMLKRCLAQT